MIFEICYLDNLEFEIWNASFFWSPDHHQTPLSSEDLDFQPSWGLREVGKVMGRVQGHPPWKILIAAGDADPSTPGTSG